MKIQNKTNCCGCTACVQICPRHCISMKEDMEGFSYPVIDEKQCMNCKLCEKVCPVKLRRDYRNIKLNLAYACINVNEEVRFDSSSGGIFSLLAEAVIDKQGIVYGAAFAADGSVYHVGVTTKDKIRILRGAKYLQSNLQDAFKEIRDALENDQIVLFSGTPCQNAGLRAYLGSDYKNLYCIDFICHGVPSPLVWKKYLVYLEKRMNRKRAKKLTPSFRIKQDGWTHFAIFIPFEDGIEYRREHNKDPFMKVFLKNIILRPSCYQCKFKPSSNIVDITLADFWGVRREMPTMYDDKGTSLVIINSLKGQKLFEAIKDKMRYQEFELEKAVRYNAAYHKSVKLPKERNIFFSKFNTYDVEKLMNEVSREHLSEKSKWVMNRILRLLEIAIKYMYQIWYSMLRS